MNSNVRKFINDISDDIRKAYGIQTPIHNMEEIVTLLGGRINLLEEDDAIYDGLIRKSSEDGFEIRISPFQSRERMNFTIAHEIGHLFLHMGYIILPSLWERQDELEYKRFGKGDDEYEANEFAAAFLMPKDEYRDKIIEFSEDRTVNMKKVAEYFNVSVQAAINRGRFLGYLEW